MIGDEKGTVEYVGIKSTRLRSVTGEQIVISNGDLLKSRVRNFSRLAERRADLIAVGIVYETPRELIRELPKMHRGRDPRGDGRALRSRPLRPLRRLRADCSRPSTSSRRASTSPSWTPAVDQPAPARRVLAPRHRIRYPTTQFTVNVAPEPSAPRPARSALPSIAKPSPWRIEAYAAHRLGSGTRPRGARHMTTRTIAIALVALAMSSTLADARPVVKNLGGGLGGARDRRRPREVARRRREGPEGPREPRGRAKELTYPVVFDSSGRPLVRITLDGSVAGYERPEAVARRPGRRRERIGLQLPRRRHRGLRAAGFARGDRHVEGHPRRGPLEPDVHRRRRRDQRRPPPAPHQPAAAPPSTAAASRSA